MGLRARFDQKAFEDPLSDFKELYQEGTLQDYMDTFDMLAS